MKIAVFFPSNLFCSWGMSWGIVDCLKRMGHEVVGLPVEPHLYQDPQGSRGKWVGDLSACDGVIISGPEHIYKYVAGNWADVPTVAWLHETVEREDYGKLDVESLKRSADVVFCPAIQDEKYGFAWLPLGVDTEIFKPDPEQPKTIDAGFIGLLYDKRRKFLEELKPYLNGTKLHVGNVRVNDADGSWNPRKTAEAYAKAIRSMKVFVNLPSLSQTAVSKVYEVLACQTYLMTPLIKDVDNFDKLKGFQFYETAKPDHLAYQVKEALDSREWHRWSEHSANQIQLHDRLELRCEKLVHALVQVGAKAVA